MDSHRSSLTLHDEEQHTDGVGRLSELEHQDLPYHTYHPRTKTVLVIIVSCAASLSGLSSNVYFPAQVDISKGLNISKQTVNLSITTYMLAQGIGPSFWGALADNSGRRATLLLTLVIYAGANIALALVVNGPMLLVFRGLQAFGSSSTIALGAGIIADICAPHERGGYLGWFSGIRQISLAAGPVIGGILANYAGWRSIFWFLTGLSLLSVVLIALFLPETLRRIAGNGSTPVASWIHRPLLWSAGGAFKKRDVDSDQAMVEASRGELKPARPFKAAMLLEPLVLLCEPDTFCAVIFGGCIYTAWSMMLASTTYLFEQVYGFNTLEVGFCFLANGLGCVLGSVLAGRTLDSDFLREAQLWQHTQHMHPETPLPSKPLPLSFPLEQARLRQGKVYTLVAIWSLLLFGWSLTAPDRSNDPKSHWMTPLLAQFTAGWSATSVLACNSALIVDVHPDKSASASAILNLGRCLLGAAGVAAVEPFLHKYSPGLMSLLLVGIILPGAALLLVQFQFGPLWRARREARCRS